MIRRILTLLAMSPVLALANPAPILELLYASDDLVFLAPSQPEAAGQTIKTLSQDAAQSIAADLSDALISDDAKDPIYAAKRLANVGILQTYAGDFIAGDQSLRSALTRFSQTHGLFDPQLTSLLSAIGINAFLREDYDTAEDHFRWSQHIQHRNHGPFAAEQTPNLNWLSRIYLKTDNNSAADIAQRYVLAVAKQVLPKGSAELSEVKIAIASYLGQRAKTIPLFAEDLDRLLRQTLFTEAIDLLEQALLEIKAAKGEYAFELIEALTTKALVHSWRGRDGRLQEQALEQIVAIIENQAGTSPAQLAEAWLTLADGYTLTGNKKARLAYYSAWQAANPTSTDPEPEISEGATPEPDTQLPVSQTGSASKPTDPVLLWPNGYQPIYFDLIEPAEETPPNPEYAVNLSFTVSKQGRPKRVKVLNRNVPSREVRWTRSMILGSRYRPALRNGIAEEAEFTARQTFVPRPAFEPAPSDAEIDAATTTDNAANTDRPSLPDVAP